MRISMRGMCKNSRNDLEQVQELLEIIQEDEDLQEILDERYNVNWERMHLGEAKMCISTLHDCILAVANGDENMEEVKRFLAIDDEKPNYYNELVQITPKEQM